MPIDIVIGGQYGGEGKGLITTALIWKNGYNILIKAGGPNSCHTYMHAGKTYRIRMVPSGAHLSKKTLVFPAGCLVSPVHLFKELAIFEMEADVIIDPNAGIIPTELIESQRMDVFYQQSGSTLTGTGYASAERAKRRLRLAKDEPDLAPFIRDTQEFLYQNRSEKILAEGGQGYGLSNYHGDYPYVTSRDTTVNSVLAQIGAGPKELGAIILTVKCFPTRNQTGTGKLLWELPAEFVERHKDVLGEYGGGIDEQSDLPRRVGLFDQELLKRACIANSPTYLALTGLDKLETLLNREESIRRHYGSSVTSFKSVIEQVAEVKIGMESNGNSTQDVQFNF